MHQDVYNEMFEGEGAPSWAVCTNGVPSVDPPGRWSLEYGTKAAGIAFSHFWRNNVRGDLQGQYDEVWADVAGPSPATAGSSAMTPSTSRSRRR